jgi:hypothetical protein
VVQRRVNGETEFRVYRPEASDVLLMGDFTRWHDEPIAMTADGDGWWSASLPLEPGDYEFQYLVDHRWWLADYAASGVRLNDFGTWVSLLHVAVETPAPQSIPVHVLGVRAAEPTAAVA